MHGQPVSFYAEMPEESHALRSIYEARLRCLKKISLPQPHTDVKAKERALGLVCGAS